MPRIRENISVPFLIDTTSAHLAGVQPRRIHYEFTAWRTEVSSHSTFTITDETCTRAREFSERVDCASQKDLCASEYLKGVSTAVILERVDRRLGDEAFD